MAGFNKKKYKNLNDNICNEEWDNCVDIKKKKMNIKIK